MVSPSKLVTVTNLPKASATRMNRPAVGRDHPKLSFSQSSHSRRDDGQLLT